MTQMSPAKAAWSAGGLLFAGVAMLVLGGFLFLQGATAIARDELFASLPSYLYRIDTEAWGWLHVISGVVLGCVGFFVLRGADWARGAGIALAAVGVLAQLLFVAYYPLWALVIMGLNVFVIWALAVAPDR